MEKKPVLYENIQDTHPKHALQYDEGDRKRTVPIGGFTKFLIDCGIIKTTRG